MELRNFQYRLFLGKVRVNYVTYVKEKQMNVHLFWKCEKVKIIWEIIINKETNIVDVMCNTIVSSKVNHVFNLLAIITKQYYETELYNAKLMNRSQKVKLLWEPVAECLYSIS